MGGGGWTVDGGIAELETDMWEGDKQGQFCRGCQKPIDAHQKMFHSI